VMAGDETVLGGGRFATTAEGYRASPSWSAVNGLSCLAARSVYLPIRSARSVKALFGMSDARIVTRRTSTCPS
jgi:hypothetical protein